MLELSWTWDLVPAADEDRDTWIASMGKILDEMVGDQIEVARANWPEDSPDSFPFTPGAMGTAVASDLIERADMLPEGCRLIWGAGFFGEQVRWVPLMLLAEFKAPREGEDPAYLMAMVGAEGMPDDIREPNVEYFSTSRGDGVRVIAIARTEEAGTFGRVQAALRLERPEGDLDVLLDTRIADFEQLGAIGHGIEAAMNLIADSTHLRFTPVEAEEPVKVQDPS
ncbi:hypothetical protein [Actinoplanes couchii]|uniref:PH domain-containing protein n=1 Tax=Actinoplanes couchii TaxID=403638 RepID=A0ABQ3X3S8_9ACTN|nr:hypothetical protein [Actinoplanes couchii]MDR6322925.1 hypothetical protein [Actinoplanes couchii]GID53165.1 hypothetical protein Aco03nite_015690 [Actinoplanes couchii]